MTTADRKIREKRLLNKMVTEVRSIDGKSLADIAPNLKNEFESYTEAFREIMKVTGKRPDSMFTRRVNVAQKAARV